MIALSSLVREVMREKKKLLFLWRVRLELRGQRWGGALYIGPAYL